MKRDYKELLAAGNKAQLEKLKMNEHKTGFDDIELGESFEYITQEMKELVVEFAKMAMGIQDYEKIRYEAADVANCAHFIILACDKILNDTNI